MFGWKKGDGPSRPSGRTPASELGSAIEARRLDRENALALQAIAIVRAMLAGHTAALLRIAEDDSRALAQRKHAAFGYVLSREDENGNEKVQS